MPHKLLAMIGLGGLLLALAGLPARPLAAAPSAVTFTVDTTLDLIDGDTSDGVCTPGSCSLRAAIMQANKLTAPGVHVILVPAGTYTLTRPVAGANGADNGDLNLAAPVSGNPAISIVGAGAATTVIDANQIDRVFYIAAGRIASLTGLTIRGGFTIDDGGGILNFGTLDISESLITGSAAGNDGGGLASFYGGTLTIRHSTISGNQAADDGGGLANGGTLTIRHSTISGNQAADDGGGLINFGSLVAVNVTISQNAADENGGGLANFSSTAYLFNATIVFNDADVDANHAGSGGGIYDFAGTVWLINSLVAGNFVFASPFVDDCTGTMRADGRVLLWQFTGCTIDTTYGTWTTLNSLDLLGPLQNNGGPTATHALLPGSNAIDGALASYGCIDSTAGVLLTDQRGAARGTGTACDIGAYEYVANPPLFLPFLMR